MAEYFVGTYSDKQIQEGNFKDLPAAVKWYLRDVIGHTLSYITNQKGRVVWTADAGFFPKQPSSMRAIKHATPKRLFKAIPAEVIFNTIVRDKKTDSMGTNTGASYSYEDGVMVIKDSRGQPRKTLRIFVEEVALVSHKFGEDFLCKRCNRHMAEIEDPTGLCE